MKKIIIHIIVLILIANFSAVAQSGGTTSFEFLRNQYSPRGAAMGGNLIANKGDIHAILYNPAALSGNTFRQWSLDYVDHLLDFQAGYLAYAQPFQNIGNVSVGLIYFNYGSFDETNQFGEVTGRTFGASEFALNLALSNTLGDNFDYGIGMKFIYSGLDEVNASAVALDAGLLYTVKALDNLQLGISLMNLGTTVDNYTTHEEKLPTILQVGFSKRLAHLPLLLSASLKDIAADEETIEDRLKKFSIGGEFDVSEVIKFRLGYQNEINRSVKPLGRNVLSGISLGLGILWNKLRLDYSYSSVGDLGDQNRLGITGHF